MLYLDIDEVKTINDSLGHGQGDSLLINVSNILTACCNNGFVARWAANEFLIVFSDISLSEGEQLADRLNQSSANLTNTNNNSIFVAASMKYCGTYS
ncbi:GGDEF domain-containing protein [Vibrio chagasii]|nr:GGDEF domain-containing protein [Vibrio chagasii]